MKRRGKEWWGALTKQERARLVWLESADGKSSGYGGGGYIPDDCCECGSCGAPHLGTGLCRLCLNELIGLLDKADAAIEAA